MSQACFFSFFLTFSVNYSTQRSKIQFWKKKKQNKKTFYLITLLNLRPWYSPFSGDFCKVHIKYKADNCWKGGQKLNDCNVISSRLMKHERGGMLQENRLLSLPQGVRDEAKSGNKMAFSLLYFSLMRWILLLVSNELKTAFCSKWIAVLLYCSFLPQLTPCRSSHCAIS